MTNRIIDPLLCVCGHGKQTHALNMKTFRNTGPCWYGHYIHAPDQTRCYCRKYEAKEPDAPPLRGPAHWPPEAAKVVKVASTWTLIDDVPELRP